MTGISGFRPNFPQPPRRGQDAENGPTGNSRQSPWQKEVNYYLFGNNKPDPNGHQPFPQKPPGI